MKIVTKLVSRKSKQLYLIAGILIGVACRFYLFGEHPKGMSGEEVSSAFEAHSLSETGKDRWGIDYPVYFIAWGSGQNTLYAYFSIPFIKLFGMNAFGIRFLSGILGLLTLFIVFLLLKRILRSSNWALFGVFIYTINPWHFVLSRWSFEENPVPFFIILGIYLLIKSHDFLNEPQPISFSKKIIIIVSWIPFALLFYAYAMSLFIIPIFVLFYIIFNYQFLLEKLKYHCLSFGLFIFLSLPFFLFILKNNVLKHTLSIEKYLPFSLPKMLFPRDEIIKSFDAKRKEIFDTARFFYRGFSDKNVYNATDLDTPHYFLLFALIGFIFSMIKYRNERKFEFGILVAWLISASVVFLLFFMNLNRSMHLQALIPLFIVIGVYYFISLVSNQYKKYFTILCGLYFIFTTGVFVREYFFRYPTYSVFVMDFEDALAKTEKLRFQNENIAVTPSLLQNYLYVLVHSQFSAAKFHESNWKHANNRPYVYSFGHYFMLGTIEYFKYEVYQNNIDLLAIQNSNLFILQRGEKPLDGQSELLYENKYWVVYRCIKTKKFDFNDGV